MKFAPMILGVMILMSAMVADASPLKVLFQDVKLPTQRVLERQVFTAPLASNSTYIVSGAAGATSAAAATLAAFTHQPDFPRNLEITPDGAGAPASVGTCALTVTGTDINNHTITEVFNFVSGSGAKVVGAKAFKTIATAAWAAGCEASSYNVTWDIGIGNKLGLKRCMDNAGDIAWSELDGATATAPTMASHASVVASNTMQPNTLPNGTHNFILFYVQNYKCF